GTLQVARAAKKVANRKLQRFATALEQVEIESGNLRHTADADRVAKPRNGDLVGFIHYGRNRRTAFIHDWHGDGITLHRIDRHSQPQALQHLGRIAAKRGYECVGLELTL